MEGQNKDVELLKALEEADIVKAENGKLASELENAKAENENLLNQVVELEGLKTEHSKLVEQVEALQNLNKSIELKNQELISSQNELERLKVELEEAKVKMALSKIESSLNTALSAFTFDVNSEKRNQALKDAVKAEWSKEFKAIEKEGVLVAYDKKTQTETGVSIEKSISQFAKENGYVIEKQAGFDFKGQSQNSQVDTSLISFEDEKSADAEKRTAYQAKKAILRADFQAKGGLINSTAYYKMLAENNMISQEELNQRTKK